MNCKQIAMGSLKTVTLRQKCDKSHGIKFTNATVDVRPPSWKTDAIVEVAVALLFYAF